MNVEDIMTFREKLGAAEFEEHFDNSSDNPEYMWSERWADGRCLGVECYSRGVLIKLEDRLTDQATRAKEALLIEDKDIPIELKK